MILPVQVERPHGGGIPCTAAGTSGSGGGGGEAEGPGGLRRAEGAPGPAAHRGLDSTALRWWLLLLGQSSLRAYEGLRGAERTAAGLAGVGARRGKGEISSLFRAGETEPKHSRVSSPPRRSVCGAAPRELCWAVGFVG